MAIKVLVVEDEPGLRRALSDLLSGAGHTVEAVGDGETAVTRGLAGAFDLVLLDRMLPRLDGDEVCRRLKGRRPQLTVIMLTARGSEDDKVEGLGSGADDYVTKPFGARELMARIEAAERRIGATRPVVDRLLVDDCELDLGRHEAQRAGMLMALTDKEVRILRLLYSQRTRAVTRAEMLEKIWDVPGDLNTRTVDMTIANLRQKIERNPAEPRIILTVKGVGYAWGKP